VKITFPGRAANPSVALFVVVDESASLRITPSPPISKAKSLSTRRPQQPIGVPATRCKWRQFVRLHCSLPPPCPFILITPPIGRDPKIFKDGLRRTVMGGTVKRKKSVRYFSRAELKQLFTLYPAGDCRVRKLCHLAYCSLPVWCRQNHGSNVELHRGSLIELFDGRVIAPDTGCSFSFCGRHRH